MDICCAHVLSTSLTTTIIRWPGIRSPQESAYAHFPVIQFFRRQDTFVLHSPATEIYQQTDLSAASDLLGPVQAVQRLFPHKRVIVAFPPDRNSNALMGAASGYLCVGRDVLAKSVFPNQLRTAMGFLIQRPIEWP